MNERERLLQLIEAEGMTAKQFAEEAGIQAGTISNIVNGRNRPSLDVMQRVLNRFRTLNSDWLILGVGSMYRGNAANTNSDTNSNEPAKPVEQTLFDSPSSMEHAPSYEIQKPAALKEQPVANIPVRNNEHPISKDIEKPVQRSIEKIVVFYSDGTFEEMVSK